MIYKTKELILEVLEIVLLLTLLAIRLFISSDENTWISLLNYIGLLISIGSLYFDLYSENSTHKKFAIVTGITIILLSILVIFAALIGAEVIIMSTKANDIVLLVTLLVTLPSRLYKKIISSIVKP